MGQHLSVTDAVRLLKSEVGIIGPYIPTDSPVTSKVEDQHASLQSIVCLAPKDWLLGLSSGNKEKTSRVLKAPQFSDGDSIEILQPSHCGHKNGWVRVKLTILKKPIKPFRLCKEEGMGLPTANFFTVYDTLAKDNRQMKKKLFKQKLNDLNLFLDIQKDRKYKGVEYYKEETLPDLLRQLCGIQIQQLGISTSDVKLDEDNTRPAAWNYWSNLHILPVIAAFEGTEGYYIIEPSPQCTLSNALSYNPKILSLPSLNPMFLIYQLLQILSSYESKCISLSNLFSSKDLYLVNNLWLYASALHVDATVVADPHILDASPVLYRKLWTDPSIIHGFDECSQDLATYTDLWISSNLSNFEYLLILNKFAGRRPFDPHHHPVMPWVTDFRCKNGGYRDLSKSMFRLKKGDTLLNSTYKSDGFCDIRNIVKCTAPHHVTEILSDLSYYLYFARRTPKSVVCAHVRPQWVPDEYPQTVEKLYDQAVEECIPEFFCDPNILISIHSDMKDLEVPDWLGSPEEFIAYHREVLESDFVSSHLHLWIDLVFGYKLLGDDAVKAKNVYLSMVTEDLHITNCGVMPLFASPHPFKWFPSEECPESNIMTKQTDYFREIVEANETAFEENSSPSSTYQILSHESNSSQSDLNQDTNKFTSGEPIIPLPNGSNKDWDQEVIQLGNSENFLAEMEAVESLLKFQIGLGNYKVEKAGDFKYGTVFDREKTQITSIVKNLSSGLKLLLCVATELFLHHVTRQRSREHDLDDRTVQSLRILRSNRKDLPRWLANLLNNLSGVVTQDTAASRNRELPNNIRPSASLNSAFNIFNFPKYFPTLHKFLASLYSSDSLSSSDVASLWISRPSHLPSKGKIADSVEGLCRLLEEVDVEGLELLLTFLMPFFEAEATRIPSLLHLLYPIGRTIGQRKSMEMFLRLVTQTYDRVDVTKSEDCQIFTQGYVSKLINVFGVEVFMEFIFPFVLDGLLGNLYYSELELEKSSTNLGKLKDMDPFSRQRQVSSSDSSSSANEGLGLQGKIAHSSIDENMQGGVDLLELCNVQCDEDSPNMETSTINGTEVPQGDSLVNFETNEDGPFEEDQSMEALPSPPDLMDTHMDEGIESITNNIAEKTTETMEPYDSLNSDPYGEESVATQDPFGDTDIAFALGVAVEDTSVLDTSLNLSGHRARLRSVSESAEVDPTTIVRSTGLSVSSQEKSDSEDAPFTLLLPTSEDDDVVEANADIVEPSLNDVEDIPFEESKYDMPVKGLLCESDIMERSVSVNQLCHESVLWLIPWLGPLLATKFIVKKLFKKLPRLFAIQKSEFSDSDDSIAQNKNEMKDKVINCLVEIAQVYGNEIIKLHYVPFAIAAVHSASTGRLISSHLEGHLLAAFTILQNTLMLVPTTNLMKDIEHLSDKVFQPLLRTLSTLRSFHSGHHARTGLSKLLVDTLGMLSQKFERDFAQEALMSLLQQFFSCFDGIYVQHKSASGYSFVVRKFSVLSEKSYVQETDEKVASNGTPSHNPEMPYYDDYSIEDIIDTFSNQVSKHDSSEEKEERMIHHTCSIESAEDVVENPHQTAEVPSPGMMSYEDLYETFSASLAYYAYVLFCRTLGEQYMEKTLYNSELIWQLCANHDERLTLASCPVSATEQNKVDQGWMSDSNVDKSTKSTRKRDHAAPGNSVKKHLSTDSGSSQSFRSTWQHISGSWLELCENREYHKNYDFEFQNRRLQTYAGHSAAVRDIHVPENEHFFLSASRDRTVKFWLLKNHGNGTAQLGNTGFYDKHTKPVFAVQSITSKRLAVSCDGSVHVWDPITGAAVSKFEPPKGVSAVAIRTLPAPQTAVVVATSEGLARLYDVRQKMPFGEWKTLPQSMAGGIRSMAVPYDCSWLSVGFSTGVVSLMDMRTGILRNQWKAHDSEILQILPSEHHAFLSVSVESRVKYWTDDGTLLSTLKPPQESLLSAALYKGKCIWASSNRIGVYHSLANAERSISRKITNDIFKGNISKMTVLPMNQLFLVGSETGNIILYE